MHQANGLRLTFARSSNAPRQSLAGHALPAPQRPHHRCRSRGVRLVVTAEKQTDKKTDRPTTPDTAPGGGRSPSPATEQLETRSDRLKFEWPANRSWLAVALDQALDSVLDVGTHLRRGGSELPRTLPQSKLRPAEGGVLRLQAKKPVVLVLGSGWGAHSFIKVMDTDAFEVVLVSPRNHFFFTPMLPSSAVGTVEFRSLLDPIRTANEFVTYFEANCDSVDLTSKVAICTSAITSSSGMRPTFEVPYDYLVVSVGEQPATFGVPGVQEHTFFMKEILDAVKLRARILELFELASLPGTSEEDVRQLLRFVVVGGGPTGVEFAGTLGDFVRQDLKRKYPELMEYVQVTLLQSADSILTVFQADLSARAMSTLQKSGIEVRTGVRVVEVTQDEIVLKGGERVPYGACVWSTGNAPRQLIRDLVDAIPDQARHNEGPGAKLAIDPFCRVVGALDVMAVGDCTQLIGQRLPTTAQVAGQQGAYVAHVLSRGYAPGFGGIGADPPSKPLGDLSVADRLFGTIDAGSLMASVDDSAVYLKRPFEFLSLGIMAYVGMDRAIVEVEPAGINVAGQLGFLLWRSVYLTKQVSLRNRVLILFDWLKARVFGRDLSQF